MSELAAMAGGLEWEQRQLRDLSTAMLALESESLGKAEALGISDAEIALAHSSMREFIGRLLAALRQLAPPPDLEPLVGLVRSTPKPVGDWIEDLDSLAAVLDRGGPAGQESLPVIEELLSLLDDDFASELHRLYDR
jgi:hypothetical protein